MCFFPTSACNVNVSSSPKIVDQVPRSDSDHDHSGIIDSTVSRNKDRSCQCSAWVQNSSLLCIAHMVVSHKQSTGRTCQGRSIAIPTPMIIFAPLVDNDLGVFYEAK
jgi:hypothetical protein